MKLVKISVLFDVHYGVNLELNDMTEDPKGINFISRTANNNGVSARVKLVDNLEPTEEGVLTVAGGGQFWKHSFRLSLSTVAAIYIFSDQK